MEFKVKLEKTLTNEDISNLLCLAFEGGSNYWYEIVDYNFPKGISLQDFEEGGKFTNPDRYWHPCQLIPLQEGCSITIKADDDDDDGTYELNLESVRSGLRVMADNYPRHLSDYLEQNDDADTGDVFLQCCLFADVVYG